MDWVLLLKAAVMGLVEGLTEFLPISSTGHLILAAALLDLPGEKIKLFEVVIQTGAILAVVALYAERLLTVVRGLPHDAASRRFVANVALGFFPAALAGVLFIGFIKAVLFNPRNAYQNYNCAVNLSDRTIYTYMGVLKPKLGNANYCSAGQLSPLLNDPFYRTIGIGTRIFLGGGVGYVTWQGTQHNPDVPRRENGIPRGGAGTLAVIGDLKQMKPEYLVGTSFRGYGCTLTVGIGVPIPILDEEVCRFTTVTDADITAPIVDYSKAYPNMEPGNLGEVSYAELRSGFITVQGKRVPTASLSSYPKAVEIATKLKAWIKAGWFLLTEPVQLLRAPGSGYAFKPFTERPVGK